MAEEILFESGALKVTTARVVLGAATYAVAGITSVKAGDDNNWAIAGALGIIVGTPLLAFDGFARVLGGAIVVGCVLAIVFGRASEVIVTTGAAEQVAFRSRDRDLVLKVASAVNLAIMKRLER